MCHGHIEVITLVNVIALERRAFEIISISEAAVETGLGIEHNKDSQRRARTGFLFCNSVTSVVNKMFTESIFSAFIST